MEAVQSIIDIETSIKPVSHVVEDQNESVVETYQWCTIDLGQVPEH